MFIFRPSHLLWTMFLLTILGMALSDCTLQLTPVSRLRIINSGSHAINNLVVIFPKDHVKFGNLPAGTTSEYMDAPNGVFRYAAYEFEVDGKVISQPVIDWVGEKPIDGQLFSYKIDFDLNRTNIGDRVRLIDVKIDQ